MAQKNNEIHEETVLAEARSIIGSRFQRGKRLICANDAQEMAIHEFSTADREIFACLFLDNRHAVLSFEKLFFGTIDRSHVHPRVVAKRALDVQAGAVILIHNHPSGDPEPSNSDIALTKQLIECLTLFDVRVLDHIIVGGNKTLSFAEKGLL